MAEVTIKVDFYETATMRKKGIPMGYFFIQVEQEEVPEVSESLKGKITADGEDMYEMAVKRREAKIEKTILDTKFAACDKVREIVGDKGVLVAYPYVEEKEDN